jgi:hypothetical protein
VGGLLCRRDRSKNPCAPDAKLTILKLSPYWARLILPESN